MKGTRPFSWLSAVAFLLLCTPSQVDARQQFVCWPIAAGDTASSLARRLTGSAAAAYGLGFQIRDPARRMFVPKSHYQHLQSDWQACVAPGPAPNSPVATAPVVELAETMVPDEPTLAAAPQALVSAPPTPSRASRTPFDVPFATTIGAGVLLIVLLSAVAGSLAPRAIPPDAQRAGENFVAVFARPLLDESSSAPPIRSRVRFRRRRRQIEISIAPGPGHRYPNLADHKMNVDYDVDRVLEVLGDYSLSRPTRASGEWVVITICPVDGSSKV
jgi:hypothetical protein